MKSGVKKDWYVLILVILTLALMLIPMGPGNLYGAEGDWFSQHLPLAESLRQRILETGNLIPQYINLGGGSSIYDFAYYGLLRPDVLIGCLLPMVSMKYIITIYAMVGVLASVLLCNWWLRGKMPKLYACMGAVLFACATCFYHAHHQIMFVNYMPFLMLALIGVDRLLEKNRSGMLLFGILLMYLHSFYYSIASLFAILLYYISCLVIRMEAPDFSWTEEAKVIRKGVIAVLLATGIAMALLLPMGLDILTMSRSSRQFGHSSMALLDVSLTGLLYSSYGCGLTLIALYCLLVSLRDRKRRIPAIVLLLCVSLPVISLVLNGFLYARAKILIPFLPLIIRMCAQTLYECRQQGKRFPVWAWVLCLLPLASCHFFPQRFLGSQLGKMEQYAYVADAGILLVFIVLQRFVHRERLRKAAWVLVFLMPVGTSLVVNANDTYISYKDARQSRFTREEIEEVVTDNRYRFDVVGDNFANCNLLVNGTMRKTSMYSSITESGYTEFYYNTIHNPVRIRNRLALLPSTNPFFAYMMGERYLMTTEQDVPDGYHIVKQKGKCVLAENENVLPVCYGTSSRMSEKEYQALQYPETMEALCTRAVLTDMKWTNGTTYTQPALPKKNAETKQQTEGERSLLHVVPREESDFFRERTLRMFLNQQWGSKTKLSLRKTLSNQYLIISFDVISEDGKEVTIYINGMRNRLSSKNAAYPNQNSTFTYVLSSGQALKHLRVTKSEGNYRIENLKIYTLNEYYAKCGNYVIPTESEKAQKQGSNVFTGQITMEKDGYLVTSFPYRKGYSIEVDGEKVTPEKVNTAFLGCPLKKGTHTFRIRYHAPGFRIGSIVSTLSILFCIVYLYDERKNG